MNTRIRHALLTLLLSGSLWACAGDRPDLPGFSISEGQVRVVYDLNDKPFPNVPLPTDVATRLDDTSLSGRYVNISKVGVTFVESDTRTRANQLTGFGTYMPITLSFDGAIDVANVIQRHCDNSENWMESWARKACPNKDKSDDVIWLINIDSESPDFGQKVSLDLGQGNFPLVLEKQDNYFDADPRVDGSNLLYETYNEDVDGDGELDFVEDSNGDGILGVANVVPGMAEALVDDPGFRPNVDDLTAFFEIASNTFISRPVLPLRQLTEYAVVITTNMLGHDGKAVQSPFDGGWHHAAQKTSLAPLNEILGSDMSKVAFAWSFTTQDLTTEMESIRAGLYGSGPFKQLAEEFPVSKAVLFPMSEEAPGETYILSFETFGYIFNLLIPELAGGSDEAVQSMIEDLGYVDYIVSGTIPGPNFLADRNGLATENYPHDDDESFQVNPKTGEAFYGETRITWWCMVPKATEDVQPPFDVLLYGHGYTSSRLEMLGFAGRTARHGAVTCAIDAYGHGLTLPNDELELPPAVGLLGLESNRMRDLLYEAGDLLGFAGFVRSMEQGRHRDLNNDGEPDSGGDFWTYDIFHTRDIVRQSIVDWIQFFRLVRSFDGENLWQYDSNEDGLPDLAGDFNGDGVVDFGGKGSRYGAMGGSLGGILSGIIGGIEPTLDAAAPVAGGAGLIDIGVRSKQGGVPEAVFMPFFGPLVVGDVLEDSPTKTRIRFQVSDVNKRRYVHFYNSEKVRPGDLIVLENLENGEIDQTIVNTDGSFRVAVAADALSAMEKRVVLGMLEDNSNVPVTVERSDLMGDSLRLTIFNGLGGPVKEVIDQWNRSATWQGARYLSGSELTAVSKGHGKKRQTPGFRRFSGLAAMVLEPGDPVAFSRHYAGKTCRKDNTDYNCTLDFSYDPWIADGSIYASANVLLVPSIGDQNVPVNTGIANARAAGIIELDEIDERWGMSQNDVLIQYRVLEGTEVTERYTNEAGDRSVLLDLDDLDESSASFGEPNLDPPFRISTIIEDESGVEHTVALRVPYVEDHGAHGFGTPEPTLTFDINTFMINQIAHFFTSGGELRDDLCLEDSTCDFLPDRVTGGPFGE